MKLLADFRARVLSAKVKKATEEGEEDEKIPGPSSTATAESTITATEDW